MPLTQAAPPESPVAAELEEVGLGPDDVLSPEEGLVPAGEDAEASIPPAGRLGHLGPIIGASPEIKQVFHMIRKVAITEATVLITGESGTGKEMVATMVHRLSRRKTRPFLAVNCGAIPAALIESELFGHEKGSFTGACRAHKGYFERASGGTLFLDEISEMPHDLQVKLLRVLETGKILRVGGTDMVDVDVRVIAATNRAPEDALREGKLREDLYYRLAVFPIHLPPLRARGDDAVHLAKYFLRRLGRANGMNKVFAPPALERLRSYTWPGNVRELKNIVHRAYILADERIDVGCLPPSMRDVESPGLPLAELCFKVGTSIEDVERQMILATLGHYSGDKKKAADTLGICLKTLYNRLNNYGF